jgi:hypothetical protein
MGPGCSLQPLLGTPAFLAAGRAQYTKISSLARPPTYKTQAYNNTT